MLEADGNSHLNLICNKKRFNNFFLSWDIYKCLLEINYLLKCNTNFLLLLPNLNIRNVT